LRARIKEGLREGEEKEQFSPKGRLGGAREESAGQKIRGEKSHE